MSRRRAALTSRMAEQKRLCRTRWRACSFCGGSSPLRWSLSRSSTARDTSAGRGRGADTESETRRSTERCSQKPVRANADRSRERQPTRSRAPAELPVARETAASQAPCAPEPPYARRQGCALGAPPGPASPRTLPHPRTADSRRPAPPTPARFARPPAGAWPGGAGTGVPDAGRGRWAGPPGALTPLQPQRLHQRSHVGAAAASCPPAGSPARRAGLREATPRAAGAPLRGRGRTRAPLPATRQPHLLPRLSGCPPHSRRRAVRLATPPSCSLSLHSFPFGLPCPPHLSIPFHFFSTFVGQVLRLTSGHAAEQDKPTALKELSLWGRGRRQPAATVIRNWE